MLNRTIPPPIHDIKNLKLQQPVVHQLDNGITLYESNLGTQEILKLEVVFQAGRPQEHKRLVARATASMLKEGTQKYTSAQIAEEMDFYGGTLSCPVSLDTSNVVLYSLTKHFEKLLPIVASMLSEPIFPQKELDHFISRNVQRLQVDLTRNDVVAYREITEKIFGETHPYGYNSRPETYEALTVNDLKQHFQTNYHSGNCVLFLSGKIEPKTIELVNQHLGQAIAKKPPKSCVLPNQKPAPHPVNLKLENSLQTAIRIGRPLFNRQHPDFNGMHILNTILGGYFGSRLMANIREEKGYTYNIFSSVDVMVHDGYFYIGTEVSPEFVAPTLKEIYHEMELLRTELVDEEELTMVRNYLLGTILTMLDGPFNVADVVKTLQVEGLEFSDFNRLVHTVKHITAEELQRLAKKYFRKEDIWQVIVA